MLVLITMAIWKISDVKSQLKLRIGIFVLLVISIASVWYFQDVYMPLLSRDGACIFDGAGVNIVNHAAAGTDVRSKLTESFYSRIDSGVMSIELLLEHPWVGNGYARIVAVKIGEYGIHNWYGRFVAAYGLIGAGLVAVPLLFWLHGSRATDYLRNYEFVALIIVFAISTMVRAEIIQFFAVMFALVGRNSAMQISENY